MEKAFKTLAENLQKDFAKVKGDIEEVRNNLLKIDKGCLSNEIEISKTDDKLRDMYKDLNSQILGQKYNIPITKQENGRNSPILIERGNQVQFKKQEDDLFYYPMPKNTAQESALPRGISGLIKPTEEQTQKYYEPSHGVSNVPITTPQPWSRTIKMQSQSTFSGKEHENVENWLCLLKVNFELNRVPVDDWIAVAATYLRDGPLKLYIGKRPSLDMSDWKSFAVFMIDNYGTRNYTNVLLEKLTNLRQQGSLRNYIDKFVEIANQIDDSVLSQKAKALHFVSKLIPELKKVTGLAEPKTLEEAIKFARNFDAWRPNNDSLEINQASKIGYKNNQQNKYCSHCKKTGHTVDNCYTFKDSQNKYNNKSAKEKLHCDYCKKSNHKVDNCYKKQNDNAKNESKHKGHGQDNRQKFVPNPKPNINVVEKTNPLIGKELNYSNGIYNTPPDELAFATATININGIETEAMFDSGARFSILPLSMVKRYGLPYDPTPTKCIMANNVSVESYGEATLNVLCHGSASQILFIILERNNVLLGIDWFRANHAYVIFDENRLVFNKREVPLNALEENKEAVNIVEINSVDTKFDESDFIDHWPLPS